MDFDKNQIALFKLSRLHGSISKTTINAMYNELKDPILILDKILNSKHAQQKTIFIPDQKDIDMEINFLIKNKGNLVFINDSFYPILLKQIDSAPMVLATFGDIEKLNTKLFSVIGTREPTFIGKKLTVDVAKSMLKKNFCIVSGLARGVDKIAHMASLEQGTIAILGHGLSECYPPEHKNLIRHIIDNNGCIVSEFSVFTHPIASNFPKRNRIIAGISSGTVVVQSSLKSGSIITAKMAHNFNRDVYAIPGSPNDQSFAGNNKLIHDNIAKIVIDINNIY